MGDLQFGNLINNLTHLNRTTVKWTFWFISFDFEDLAGFQNGWMTSSFNRIRRQEIVEDTIFGKFPLQFAGLKKSVNL
jgi:hypothetical protein